MVGGGRGVALERGETCGPIFERAERSDGFGEGVKVETGGGVSLCKVVFVG